MATTPKPKPREYLVVVKYPTAKPPVVATGGMVAIGQQQAQAYKMTKPNTVRQVTATTPEAAAEAVGVPAGATVHVVLMDHVQTFTRPEKAPLVPTLRAEKAA